jgi:hypothetical protein
MTENNERIEYTDQDQADLDKLYETGEMPTYHPLLQVWREVLKPAAEEAKSKVTPQWANRITQSYREVNFEDCEYVRDSYFAKIAELAKILDLEIASDDDCLTYDTPEDDVAENSHHYQNLLLQWQLALLKWEMDWECTDLYAGAELAAISEVHKMFFSAEGLTAHLESIRFEFTEADQQLLADALLEFRGEGR